MIRLSPPTFCTRPQTHYGKRKKDLISWGFPARRPAFKPLEKPPPTKNSMCSSANPSLPYLHKPTRCPSSTTLEKSIVLRRVPILFWLSEEEPALSTPPAATEACACPCQAPASCLLDGQGCASPWQPAGPTLLNGQMKQLLALEDTYILWVAARHFWVRPQKPQRG